MAPSRHDWKIVEWDVKPQHKQNTTEFLGSVMEMWPLHYNDLFEI